VSRRRVRVKSACWKAISSWSLRCARRHSPRTSGKIGRIFVKWRRTLFLYLRRYNFSKFSSIFFLHSTFGSELTFWEFLPGARRSVLISANQEKISKSQLATKYATRKITVEMTFENFFVVLDALSRSPQIKKKSPKVSSILNILRVEVTFEKNYVDAVPWSRVYQYRHTSAIRHAMLLYS